MSVFPDQGLFCSFVLIFFSLFHRVHCFNRPDSFCFPFFCIYRSEQLIDVRANEIHHLRSVYLKWKKYKKQKWDHFRPAWILVASFLLWQFQQIFRNVRPRRRRRRKKKTKMRTDFPWYPQLYIAVSLPVTISNCYHFLNKNSADKKHSFSIRYRPYFSFSNGLCVKIRHPFLSVFLSENLLPGKDDATAERIVRGTFPHSGRWHVTSILCSDLPY